ncbi:MAG: hypothetical protein IKN12_11875 [Selenomonadaceae bacterium]|nr:hypothetical protein [Selenomonadaceae bacterium]
MPDLKQDKILARRVCEGLQKLPKEQAAAFEQAILGAVTLNGIMQRFGTSSTPTAAAV